MPRDSTESTSDPLFNFERKVFDTRRARAENSARARARASEKSLEFEGLGGHAVLKFHSEKLTESSRRAALFLSPSWIHEILAKVRISETRRGISIIAIDWEKRSGISRVCRDPSIKSASIPQSPSDTLLCSAGLVFPALQWNRCRRRTRRERN